MNTDFSKQDLETYALAFQQGDQQAVRFLFTNWYPHLCSYIRSLIQDENAAKEIASEAFLKITAYHSQLHSSDAIRAYLYTIAKRDAYRWQQQKHRHSFLPVEQWLPDIEADHFSSMVKSETIQLLHKAITQLPPRCRQVFQLLYVQGKKTEEVAHELAISPYTVRAQRARGLALLRPKLLLLVKD